MNSHSKAGAAFLLAFFLAGCGQAELATPAAVVSSTATHVPAPAAISVDTADQVERLLTLSGHSDRVFTVVFAGNGSCIASVSPDKAIKLCDVASWQEWPSFGIGEVGMNDIAFSLDGALLACGCYDSLVHVWGVPR